MDLEQIHEVVVSSGADGFVLPDTKQNILNEEKALEVIKEALNT